MLTAVEDFMRGARTGLRFALVPAFFGLGVLWPEEAPWADAIVRDRRALDRNPLLERLEATRVADIVDRFRLDQQEALLRSLLNSRAFAVAERLSRAQAEGRAGLLSGSR